MYKDCIGNTRYDTVEPSLHMILRPEDWIVPALAQEELLDAQNPLRHLMHADVDIATTDELPGSKDYLSVLPRQSHSIRDKILLLTFQRSQCLISISLFMDASPGCGGIAWPAGQVRMCISFLRWESGRRPIERSCQTTSSRGARNICKAEPSSN